MSGNQQNGGVVATAADAEATDQQQAQNVGFSFQSCCLKNKIFVTFHSSNSKYGPLLNPRALVCSYFG